MTIGYKCKGTFIVINILILLNTLPSPLLAEDLVTSKVEIVRFNHLNYVSLSGDHDLI